MYIYRVSPQYSCIQNQVFLQFLKLAGVLEALLHKIHDLEKSGAIRTQVLRKYRCLEKQCL